MSNEVHHPDEAMELVMRSDWFIKDEYFYFDIETFKPIKGSLKISIQDLITAIGEGKE